MSHDQSVMFLYAARVTKVLITPALFRYMLTKAGPDSNVASCSLRTSLNSQNQSHILHLFP